MNNIKNIYYDLSKGKLSKKEALDSIRRLKKNSAPTDGIVVAYPEWREYSVLEASHDNKRSVVHDAQKWWNGGVTSSSSASE